jgi:hypothetical protein
VRPLTRLLAAATLVGATVGRVDAVQVRTCRPELVHADNARHVETAGDVRDFFSGRVRARCVNNPTTMDSDSVAWYANQNRLDFSALRCPGCFGEVQFRDPTIALDAQRVSYHPGEERVEAFGNVRLVNRVTGSVLTGPRLTYLRAAIGVRDTAELYATQRPTVEYLSGRDASGEPYVIRAERVRLVGSSQSWAGGNVTITRSSIDAKGDSAALDLDRGHGALIGRAEAAGRDSADYRIQGRRVVFVLERGEVTWVQAQHEAVATSADWRLAGDTIEFHLEEQLIQSGSAWGDSARPEAESDVHTITADSLWIDAPDQRLQEVRGFGDARAAALDSLSGERDWMAGDTLVARFDSTESGQRVLIYLEARLNARALYLVYDADRPGVPPARSYSRGERIRARFDVLGELERVDVVGGADGLYLEPIPVAEQPPEQPPEGPEPR